MLDVGVDGNDLWVTTSYGVALYDRSTTPPQGVVGMALPGTTSAIRVLGDVAYVGSGSRLYLIRKGNPLQVISSIDVGGTVNDLLEVPPYVFVAATNGITNVDLIDPARPAIAGRLSTTAGGAFSLARRTNTLYAADGDQTVELYTIQIPSVPQKIGTVNALPRSTSVQVSGSVLFVSDGQQSQLFAVDGSQAVPVSTWSSIPTSSFFSPATSIALVSGVDRRIRAIDFTQLDQPVILWQSELAPSGGNLNRIQGIAGTAASAYFAGGDIGLATADLANFRAPHPVRLHPGSTASSLGAAGATIVVAEGTKLARYRRDSGRLDALAPLDDGRASIVHDNDAARILGSSGSALTLWDAATGSVVSSASLRSAVVSAVLQGNAAFVVLLDKSFWRIDLTTAAATATEIVAMPAHSVARSGNAIATAQIDQDSGRTILRYWSDSNTANAPVTLNVDGGATSGVALSGSKAIVVPFRGVTIADFSNGSIKVVPETAPGTDLVASGDSVYFLTRSVIQQISVAAASVQRSWSLPAEGTALAMIDDSTIGVASDQGVIFLNVATTSSQPLLATVETTNSYEKKIVAGGDRISLFDGRSVDNFVATAMTHAPRYQFTLPLDSTAADVAADDARIYTLSANGRVSAYEATRPLASFQIDEGADVVAHRIFFIAGALHVTFTRGCSAGACEKKTIVLDPRNGLQQTASYSGALLDAVDSGTIAFIVTELPAEIRQLDIRDPWHPAAVKSVAAEGNPVSIAYSDAQRSVYTLGAKLYAYDSASLAKRGELLQPWVVDPSGRITYLDQRVRISGSCGVIAGREFDPLFFDITGPLAWGGPTRLPSPAAVRGVGRLDGAWYFLSDYSLEAWSEGAQPERGRGVRR